MAYTTINKGTDYFNTKLYTGTGSSMSVTGVGFRPDWTWIKTRNAVNASHIVDVVRGVGQAIASDLNNAQYSSGVTSFDSDGFSLTGGTGAVNNSNGSTTYVSWNWLAGGSQGSSNTDGSINTTYTSVNTTAGFSISQYTGTGSNATIGHGLGAVPKMILVKRTNTTGNWTMYHNSIGATKYIYLNQTAVEATASGIWNDTTPTSSVFSVGTDGEVNASGSTYIAYAFAEKVGYSKFGLYEGNGNTQGAFVHTGFKPAFVMLKGKGNTSNWGMHDGVRDIDNPISKGLIANTTAAEDTSTFMDFLSNGFQLRSSSTNRNASGQGYIYWAFAERPFVATNDIPTTAR
tara:strand:+ start:1404 stop:2441 length:1038 start_codon:yes stop_codon:yes gene_type:complete